MANERLLQEEKRRIPEGFIPVMLSEKRGLYLVPREQLENLLIRSIMSPELIGIIDRLISSRINEQVSSLRRKWLGQRYLTSIALLTILMVTSVILSTLGFLVFNVSDVGLLFSYSAIASLGGIIFVCYRERKETK